MAVLNAKIGEIVVGKPPDQLQAVALGSCIGLVIFDKKSKVASLAHILLPEKNKYSKPGTPGKFAPEAVNEAIKMVVAAGGNKSNLAAKMAGGAKMFVNFSNEVNDIGSRNIQATISALQENSIDILSKDVGDNYGRTVIYETDTMIMNIKQAKNNSIKQI
jgi:chemotaxis protein CheD